MIKKIVGAFIIALLAISFLLYSNLCPILRPLPQPDGPNAVGKRSYHIIDQESKDARQPSGYAECMVQLYYPSAIQKKDAARYPYDAEKLQAYKTVHAQQSYMPLFVWSCLLDGVTSYAEPNAPVAAQSAPFPVLLFLPGIGSLSLYGSLLEELASYGYVVAEIEPPFDVELVVFPQHRIIELDPVLSKAMAVTDRTTIYAYRAEAHARWLRYILATLEKLKAMNADPESPFYNKLDLKSVGVIGHSHGGGVATDFCAHNDICKAGVNMDGWTKTAQKIEPFSKPFLFLMSEKGIDEVSQLVALMPEYATRVELKGVEHTGFSDLAFLRQPAAWFLDITPNSDEQVRSFQKRVISFFDKQLKSWQMGGVANTF